jgi:flavin reductase
MKIVSPEVFREGMSRVAGAVHIITVDELTGATAVAVSSVSDTPPTLLVCLNAGSQTAASILDNKRFCVNTLSVDDEALADIFAGRGGLKGADKFTHGKWLGGVLTSAIVSFECELESHSKVGTHEVMFGRVVAVHFGDNNSALLFRNRGYLNCK